MFHVSKALTVSSRSDIMSPCYIAIIDSWYIYHTPWSIAMWAIGSAPCHWIFGRRRQGGPDHPENASHESTNSVFNLLIAIHKKSSLRLVWFQIQIFLIHRAFAGKPMGHDGRRLPYAACGHICWRLQGRNNPSPAKQRWRPWRKSLRWRWAGSGGCFAYQKQRGN